MNVKYFPDHCLPLGRDHLALVNIRAVIYAQGGWLATYALRPLIFLNYMGVLRKVVYSGVCKN
ncbi:MAG: hypothetical protein VX225_04315 [Pseudomonadota bacterium]|nr:hypothetical protein [Pseudomonadota bacterium]